MLIDQEEIDKLLSQAGDFTPKEQAKGEAQKPRVAGPGPAGQPTRDVTRILQVRVPAIARLAHRGMPVRSLRKLAPGSVIEFEKSVEDELDLMINNRPIGQGKCVKVGEHFGLRLTSVTDPRQRIESLGP